MRNRIMTYAKWRILFLAIGLFTMQAAVAEDIDYSCIEETVKPKTRVTQNYQEFDLVLNNDCPGPVYWTMCIERMSPFNHRVLETLTPSGQLAKDKKTRVNLQMHQMEDKANKLAGYEEFYFTVTYGLDQGARPNCAALSCENAKKSVRSEIRSNLRSLQSAQDAADRKAAADCPKTGWSSGQQENCMAKVQKEAKEGLQVYQDRATELNEKLATIEPERCTVHTVQ